MRINVFLHQLHKGNRGVALDTSDIELIAVPSASEIKWAENAAIARDAVL